MSKFDIDEQKIRDMLSQITVDSSKLAEQVKSRLYEDRADMPARHRKRWTRSTIAAIVMSFVLVASATAAVLGNFDWFIERFNPDFGKIVEPVEVYSEDQGIRMEVIGAQKYNNMAIVYLSLQDITGQNRLTEQTDFRDGFSVKMNPQTQETITGVDEFISGSVMWKEKMLYFDEDTNTIYYEFNITADPDSPLAEPLKLGSFLIYFNEKAYNDEPISVSLTGIKGAETIPIAKVQFWGGSKMPDDLSSYTEALMPGHFADMPHGEKDQWVSNIGNIDGKLHVQIGEIFNKEFGTSTAELSLKDPDGNSISYDYSFVLLGDEENDLLNHEKNDYADGVYRYWEFVFPVSTEDLSGYTLCYTGSVFTGVEGSWKVSANLSDSNQNIRTWTNDISVDGHLFEYITLSPLGLQVIGTYQGKECMVGDMSIRVETVDGIIPLEGGGGSQKPDKHTFNSSWNTKAPLDITKVKAIIVNGTRIPIK
ncbi:hypothetical protein [Schinkia azotoformans]|uniref:hypothetical protein n=1 Tax=Schinkia azotoformans TaxID=1454 RepID=UPI002DBE982C|nr:hypothetical protein [Schinkia azotoformans]MEC1722985.1 hypothetical protein [Schinkia azotoformans]MED4413151.1 hypothetical protein [Schinkia azotoformans]